MEREVAKREEEQMGASPVRNEEAQHPIGVQLLLVVAVLVLVKSEKKTVPQDHYHPGH